MRTSERRSVGVSGQAMSRTMPTGWPIAPIVHRKKNETAMLGGRKFFGPGPLTRAGSISRSRAVAFSRPPTLMSANVISSSAPPTITNPCSTSVQVTAQKPP